MPDHRHQPRETRSRRHDAAVSQSLASADAAAARGDYADAVGWLDMLRSLGNDLPEAYAAKHRRWRDLLGVRTIRQDGAR